MAKHLCTLGSSALQVKTLVDESILRGLDAVVGGGGIFRLARYDLHGVWKQAGDGAAGQQDALRALAPHPAGPREPEIRAGAGLGTAELQQALQTLTRHDVVHQEGGRWRITVELFRRWVEAGAE